jgi:F-type H+-transporting ATPase subunit alpha
MNAGQSVSRVGGAAQIAAMKSVSGTLRLELAQYRELAAFSQFGSDLDEATQRTLRRGRILVEVLKQSQYAPLDVALQVAILYAATKGFLDKHDVSRVREFESGLFDHLRTNAAGLLDQIRGGAKLSGDLEAKFRQAITDFDSRFGA